MDYLTLGQTGLPMGDTGNKGLRELAQEYYQGKLSYEAYRSERTQLLDRITDQADADKTNVSNTGRTLEMTEMMRTTDQTQAVYLRWQRRLWILLIVLITILVLIWAESFYG